MIAMTENVSEEKNISAIILGMRLDGHTLEEIGNELKVTRQAVDLQLKNLSASPSAVEARKIRNKVIAKEVSEILDKLVADIATSGGTPEDVIKQFHYTGKFKIDKRFDTKSGFAAWLKRIGLKAHNWGLIRETGKPGEWKEDELEAWRNKYGRNESN